MGLLQKNLKQWKETERGGEERGREGRGGDKEREGEGSGEEEKEGERREPLIECLPWNHKAQSPIIPKLLYKASWLGLPLFTRRSRVSGFVFYFPIPTYLLWPGAGWKTEKRADRLLGAGGCFSALILRQHWACGFWDWSLLSLPAPSPWIAGLFLCILNGMLVIGSEFLFFWSGMKRDFLVIGLGFKGDTAAS